MFKFSAAALVRLKKAGWFPGRSIDTGRYVAFFEAEGFVWHDKALDFLRESGALRMEYARPGDLTEEINTDVTDANAVAADNVEKDSRIIGIPLCPIAEIDEGWTHLEMAPTGEIYVRYQIALYYAGASGEETLDALLSGDFSADFWRPDADRPNLLPDAEAEQ